MSTPKKPNIINKPAVKPGSAPRVVAKPKPADAVDPNSPLGIAREVLRRLATERLAPTPDNFETYYHKIAGTQPEEHFPDRQLKMLVQNLPRANPEQLRLAQRLEETVAERNWPSFRQQITNLFSLQNEVDSREGPARHGAGNVFSLAAAAAAEPVPDEWRKIMGDLLENAVGMLLIDAPQLAEEARDMAGRIRNTDNTDPEDISKRLQDFSYRVQWIAQDQSYIRQALLNILHLIIENISELVVDDKWLSGQMASVLELFGRPLDKKVLDELGEKLRDVIYKQGSIKRNLSEAQSRLREMLANFIDHLGELAETTGAYHSKIEDFADRVSKAGSISELTHLIGDIATETRYLEKRARSSQTEMQSLRMTVDQAHREIARLEAELEQASELVRHDPLTGALNRKGLDEMITREVARMVRRKTPLCMALLDVDNFKQLNDTLGHTTGDEALKHLSTVVRENLRPQDSCGRYGGEEFLVLLPDTKPEDAVETMRRLQRELTKRFFMHENKKLLITFSCGVTQVQEDEPADAPVKRADEAMYRAKRAGKNRVELG